MACGEYSSWNMRKVRGVLVEVMSVLSFYLLRPRFAFCFALIHRPLRLLQEAAPLVMQCIL